MGANLPRAEDALDASTMARPTHAQHLGRAFFFVRNTARRWLNAFCRHAVDRLLEIAPLLTTVLLLAVYPALRYLLREPYPAEVFRFAFICFWIGFLIVSMVRAHKSRQSILENLETNWLDRLRSLGAPLSHYALFMPLKNEGNRRVLFQTFRAVERLQLILISWISPCVRELWPVPVFLSPDVVALKLQGKSLCVSPMAAFNLVFQTIVLTSSTLLGMVVVPHTMKPIIYQRTPRRWRRSLTFVEWFRLVFSPINLHSYLLIATAQLYTQGKLALGLPIAHTSVTRK